MDIEFEARGQSDFWFACVDIVVIRDKELSPSDKAVYAVICARVDVKTRTYALSVETISEESGCSVRTVQRSLKTLVARGVLERRDRFANNRQLSSIYRIIGHRAKCYQQKQPDETPTGMGVNLTPSANLAPPLVSNLHPEDLEPGESYKNQNNPPLPPEGGEGDEESFELKAEQAGTADDRRNEAIRDLYNKILPELPSADVVTKSRIKAIKARLKDDPARKELDWWRRYFQRVREFPWLLGRNPKRWMANLDWLIKDEPMQKVLEGAFSLDTSSGRTESAEAAQKKYTNAGGEVDARSLLRETGTSRS